MECTVTLASDRGRPIPDARVLVFYRDGSSDGALANVSGNPINMPIKLNDDLLRIQNQELIDHRLDVGGRRGLFATGYEKMKMFCAAEFHRAEIIHDFIPGSRTEINLRRFENGGSGLFFHGYGSIPNFYGYLTFKQNNDKNLIDLCIEDSTINKNKQNLSGFGREEPVIIQDEQGSNICLTVKEYTSKTVIFEYEWLSTNFLHAEPDDWKPLPIDRGNPQHKEAIENVTGALGDVIEDLKGNNQHPEECAEISGVLEMGKAQLETEDSIPKSVIRQIYDGLKKAGKIVYGSAKIVGVIGIALKSLEWMVKILWGLLFPV